MPEPSKPEMKKRLSAILRLERRIEATMSEEPKPGFALNQWGSYDHAPTREKVLAEYERLVLDAPEEEYFRYLHAGALSRARQFDRALDAYGALVIAGGNHAHHARLMLCLVHWFKGERLEAQRALDTYNAACVARGERPRHTRIEQMFPS